MTKNFLKETSIKKELAPKIAVFSCKTKFILEMRNVEKQV